MSQTPKFVVRKVAVLGAGVMGAQIAAHLANANVEVVLFDLPAKEGNPNGIVLKAIDNLKKIEAVPGWSQRESRFHHCGQLRSEPGTAARMRYRHRSDR
jgi:3-hydroxyacyl-CoA dehydrogenase